MVSLMLIDLLELLEGPHDPSVFWEVYKSPNLVLDTKAPSLPVLCLDEAV